MMKQEMIKIRKALMTGVGYIIPFAAKDPLRVIPSICVGGAVGSVVAILTGVAAYAPHGGPIVTLVTQNKIWFIISIGIENFIYLFNYI